MYASDKVIESPILVCEGVTQTLLLQSRQLAVRGLVMRRGIHNPFYFQTFGTLSRVLVPLRIRPSPSKLPQEHSTIQSGWIITTLFA